MATWEDLAAYVHKSYKVADNQPGFMRLVFNLDNSRSQTIFLNHLVLAEGTEHWVQLESGIGDVNRINLHALLVGVADLVCGGLGYVNGIVTYRHAVPLADLDIAEFERPLLLVTTTADALERQFAGTDNF
jgi:hypothetical protein